MFFAILYIYNKKEEEEGGEEWVFYELDLSWRDLGLRVGVRHSEGENY